MTDDLPIVLLHGSATGSYSWAAVRMGLEAHGSMVAAPDMLGYRLADDVAQWLHPKVAPTTRHAIYEQVPYGSAAEVRELWHVMDQLLDAGAAKDYGRGMEVLAINPTDMQLAAFRYPARPTPPACSAPEPAVPRADSHRPQRLRNPLPDLDRP